jgi:Ala-tRNA(Pro) deacylase
VIPATPNELFARLATLGIRAETHAHEAVFTVAESRAIKAALPGAHTKNLFLKDRKDRLFLLTARDETGSTSKRLHEALGASGRLSFGSADLLRAVLGVEPGSVTPLAVVNDREGRVAVILDASLMAFERINVHPLVNTMTTGLSRDDLVAFLTEAGHAPRVLSLPEPPAGAARDEA